MMRWEKRGVGFVGGEVVPALEDLLASVVVGGKRVGYGRGGGGSELGEKEEDGSEAEKREKRKERNFLPGALRISFPCGHSNAR
ncbi:hypothetical protein LR48_Vigan03g261600 [Vigna angularis]|uniref:Uncharacterized protein n=1 Tax=Phaseolus angularis TaxID=3914 RepID=A0A0L9U9M8_PHAAN|nr:hypothetical protein LR48_Vigan03g261600 [Vigna angularis]